MRSLNSLTWRNLTAHPLRSILTALAITLGVGMVLAAAIVGQAAGQSATEISAAGPPIDLEVFSRDGAPFDAAVLDTLRDHPDVERVSASLRVEAQGVRPAIPHLTLLGVAPEAYSALHQPTLTGGTFLDGPDTIVLPVSLALRHGLYIGDEVTLAAGGHTATLTVSGRLKAETGVESLTGRAPEAFVPLRTAQTLWVSEDPKGHLNPIDRVEVALSPGVDVERAKADLALAIGPDLAVVQAASAAGVMGNVLLVQAGLAMVGLIICFAAGFVILNAFAMSVAGRTREIGALRALGMTRRQVLRAVLAEAGLLGLLGTAVGMLAGLGLAWGVMRAMGTLKDVPFAVPWWGPLASGLMGLGVTLVAALQPAWRASRVSPIVAARPETTVTAGWYVRSGGRVGAMLMGLLLAALTAYGLLGRPDVFRALAVMVAGQAGLLGATVLLLPGLIAPVTALCRPLLMRWLGAEGRLAADNLGRNKLRAALTAGALTAGLTIVVATSGLMTASLKGALGRIRSMAREDGFITADLAALVAAQEMTFDNFFQFISQDDLGFDLNPVVRALSPLVESGAIEVERYRFQVIPPGLSALPGAPGLFVDPEVYLRIGNFDFFEGDLETALEWMRRGRAMLLPPVVAERLGAHVGDEIPVETPHGQIMFTVAGVGGGGFLMTVWPYADGEAYFNVTKPSFLGVAVSEGHDVEVTLAQVREVLEPFPEMRLLDYRSSLDPVVNVVSQLELLLDGLLLLSVVVAALGVVNTMVINVAERRREIGLLRAVGATQRQVRRAVVAEAATLGLLAALVASGLGLLMLLAWGLLVLPNGTNSIGVRADWETIRLTMGAGLRDLGMAAAISLIFGPLIAGLAASYPARSAAAMEVVEATRSEGVSLQRREARRPERQRRQAARSLTWTLAWRNLEQNRTRTVLSVLAVALGVAVIVATGVTSTGVESGVEESVRETVAFVTDMVGVGLSVAGVMILVAAGFLIFNAFGMAVTQRRRQIGALRSLGVTRRQVMRLVLTEAFLVGGLGTLLGIAAGPMLGHGILAGMRAAGYQVGAGKTSLSGVALAAAMGLIITFLSVWLPARRATRISPLAALRPETAADVERVPATRVWAGLAVIAALWIYLAVAPPGRWTLDPWNYALPILLSLPWLGALLLIAPALIGGVGQVLRPLLARLWQASGSLMADNLRRGRGRVTVTALTFAVSMMAIVGATGVLNFFGKVLIFHAQDTRFQSGLQPGWSVSAGDFTQGVMNAGGMVAGLRSEVIAEVYRVAEGRATVGVEYPVVIPEISAVLVPNYFSSMLDLNLLAVPGNVKFLASDLETARPIMEAGCGLLLAPGAAARNGVGVGDRLTIQSRRGPLDCTVAGVVVLGMIPISAISPVVKDFFDVGDPTSVIVFPDAGVDRAALEADLRAIDQEFGDDAWLLRWEENVNTVAESTDRILSLMSSLLILAILAAALGMINTTVMSVAERRYELGLFRAVGATRRQVSAVVTGEAALIGLVGSALGLIAGAGIGAIFALAHGGNAWGYPEVDLWDAAWRSVRPALGNGLAGLIVAPLLSAAVAWFPVRAILHGSAIEMLTPPRQEAVSPRRAIFGLMRRGSVRTRFVLGTAILLLLVLAGLTAAVTTHERGYLEGLARDTLTAMVEGQAGMIELNLPDDAQTLRLDDLPTGQFDVEAMLRFRALMDEATAHGIEQFAVADHDSVVLLSLDPRQTGDLLPPAPARSSVTSERQAGQWRMQATAPIRNADGEVIGSMRMAADLAEMQRLVNRTRGALWAVGGFVTALGLLLSWVLATPLVQATGQLAAHAARIAHGDYAPLARRRRRGLPALVERTSLRTRLAAALALTVVLLVGVLELTAVPIERRHTESQLKDGMVVATEWMGQAVSEGLVTGLLPEGPLSLERMLGMAVTMDWGRLQELSERTRGQDLAYIALVDEEGVIQFSDQLALVGETTPLSATTQIEAGNWRDEEIWAISTPLRRGREGEQVGALRIGVRRAGVEAFLRESRSLFRLAGLIAVLAGVLLAQAVGGAATAPLRQLAAGVRRVGQGDLEVQFRVDTQDELALLARAFNQMVAGLREREWLRDMFGRFVSHEVAEAIRTGQVRLEGENRVVSVLFCDIRDFTARSEQSTPEEMVALLNEYLPVVVEAAQGHGGTVNKFGGDSSLIIYGAPRPLGESAYQAVLTALEMRANLEGLNQRLAARGETPIRIGVGINTGLALAGAVGPEARQEYTVIGDTVNLASRIEALNKEYPEHDVLISGWTYEALGSRRAEFEFADLGDLPIRGKAEPVQVWAVTTRRT